MMQSYRQFKSIDELTIPSTIRNNHGSGNIGFDRPMPKINQLYDSIKERNPRMSDEDVRKLTTEQLVQWHQQQATTAAPANIGQPKLNQAALNAAMGTRHMPQTQQQVSTPQASWLPPWPSEPNFRIQMRSDGKRNRDYRASERSFEAPRKRTMIQDPPRDTDEPEALMEITKKSGNPGPKIRFNTLSQDRSGDFERSLLLCALAVERTPSFNHAKAIRLSSSLGLISSSTTADSRLPATSISPAPSTNTRVRPLSRERGMNQARKSHVGIDSKPRRQTRIRRAEWERYKPRLRELYDSKLTGQQILDIISKDFGQIKPTHGELITMLESWDFEAYRDRQGPIDSNSSIADPQFDLDFSTLENTDVLEDFDFDGFLDEAPGDMLDFDAVIHSFNDASRMDNRKVDRNKAKEVVRKRHRPKAVDASFWK